MKVTYTHHKAIKTSYIPATNTKGCKMRASTDSISIFVTYDHALSVSENHQRAACELLTKLGWEGDYVGGSLDGKFYFFVYKGE